MEDMLTISQKKEYPVSLIEQVKALLLEELNLDTIADDAKQADYPEWDSLTYLRIIAAIENKFKVSITRKNINNFNSVENIIKEIKEAQ